MELAIWALAVMAVFDAIRGLFPSLPPWSGWLIALAVSFAIVLTTGGLWIDALAAAGLSAILRGVATALVNAGDLFSAKTYAERTAARRR